MQYGFNKQCYGLYTHRLRKGSIFFRGRWVCFLVLLLRAVCGAEEKAVHLDDIVLRYGGGVSDGGVLSSVVISLSDATSRGYRTLSDVLEEQAGITVTRYGSAGSFSTVSIRGSSPDQVAVYFDGVQLNMASWGGVDLSTVPLEDVSSVVLTRSATPDTAEGGRPGGTVQIYTAPASGKTSLKVSSGSFGTVGLAASTSVTGTFPVFVSGAYRRSDGDFEFLDDNATEFNTLDDRLVKRENNDFQQRSSLLKLTIPAGSSVECMVVGYFFDREQGVPGLSSNQALHTRLDTFRGIASLGVRWFGKRHHGELQASFHRLEYEYLDVWGPSGEVGLGRQHMFSREDAFSLKIRDGVRMGEFVVRLSLAGRDDDYEQEDRLGIDDSLERERFSVSADVSILGEWKNMQVALSVGKFFYDDDEAVVESMPLHGRLGLRRSLGRCAYFRGGIYRYHRVPDFFELYGDRGNTVGNPDLVPEHAVTVDAAVGVRWRDEGRGAISLEGGAFVSRYDDLIQMVFDARGVGRAVNIGEADVRGMEITSYVRTPEGMYLGWDGTFQITENLSSPVSYEEGKSLPLRPRFVQSLRLGVERGRVRLWSRLFYKGKRFQDTANLVSVPTQEWMDVGISWCKGGLQLSMEVFNVTDERLFDVGGYPLPGRTLMGKVSWRF